MTLPRTVRSPLLALVALATLPAMAGAKKEEPVPEPEPNKALSVGTFRLREPRAAEGSKLRVGFTLHMEVSAEITDRTEDLLETHRHRIRDAVFTAIRTCREREFQDPVLRLLRKRIFLRLRWVLPDLKIERLLISEYEYLHE